MTIIHVKYSKFGTTLYFDTKVLFRPDKKHGTNKLFLPEVYSLDDCIDILRDLGYLTEVCPMLEKTYSRSFRIMCHIRSFGKVYWDAVKKAKVWKGK